MKLISDRAWIKNLSPALRAQVDEQLAKPPIKEAAISPEKKSRPNKFNISAEDRRTVDGIVFDSRWEMHVYQWLNIALPSSVRWQMQPEFELQAGFDFDGKRIRSIRYVADFLINGIRNSPDEPLQDNQIVIDAKGMKTAGFKVKAKLFKARFGHAPYTPETSDYRALLAIPWEKFGIKLNKKAQMFL